MANTWSGERLETFVYNETTIEHLHRYAVAKQLASGKTVLDLACGEGYGAHLLAEEAKLVIGADNDKPTIVAAARKYRRPNLRFLNAPADNVPLDDSSVDLVVSFETIEHVPDQQAMMKEIRRVLKDDGILIISTPEKRAYTDLTGHHNPFHTKELYEAEFRSLIGEYFSNCVYYNQVSAHSSVMLSRIPSEMVIYKGDFNAVVASDGIEPRYLVGIASNGEVQQIASSIFMGDSIFQMALRQNLDALRNTVSYKLGHMLLYPLKLIRGWYAKKKQDATI